MKTIAVLCVVVAAVVARPEEAGFYNPQYDTFNAEELAENVRLLKNYGKCFLDEGPCTAEGSDFKKVIPEALKTSCGRCTPKQRVLVRTVIKAFQTKLPDIWEELVNKNDPERKYKAQFDAFLQGTDTLEGDRYNFYNSKEPCLARIFCIRIKGAVKFIPKIRYMKHCSNQTHNTQIKMKTVLVLFSMVVLVLSYETSHDDIDVEALVNDTDTLKKYTSCFVHNTDCDDNSSHFRADLHEIYEQACAKCNQVQKHMLKRYIETLKEKLPDQYQELKKHYDPEGKYSLPLETAIATA
ncbi:uncharacterized protein LOC128677888 [Plodia interpunctella]|uniref:uncharacterized protein LOC128677888 n=1 Tax=Plodia interpunctella TaxID=58824 RepID=UPI0031013367